MGLEKIRPSKKLRPGKNRKEGIMPETAEQYISRILGHVEGQDPIKVQRATAGKLKNLVHGLTTKQLKWKPEPAKWSIAEIVAHLADAEIVASWRMRLIIGANGTTIQPFDQNVWAAAFRYHESDVRQSLEVFRVLRDNNLVMLRNLPPAIWDNYGMHLERGKESIAHLVRMFAGHDTNHVLQVERIAAVLKKDVRRAGKKSKKSSKRK
jgi:hypothetical protein